MDNKGIVLAAGSGSRMKSSVKKQYLQLGEKPLLYYSLKAMEDSPYIGEVVLVVGANEQEYAALEIVDRYNLKKVKKQWIRLNDKIELLDTPGILWPKLEQEKMSRI